MTNFVIFKRECAHYFMEAHAAKLMYLHVTINGYRIANVIFAECLSTSRLIMHRTIISINPRRMHALARGNYSSCFVCVSVCSD